MGYASLWCKSNYSFLEGASHPEELVETAASLGLHALALTDRDGVYGVVRAHVRAKALGVKLLVGAQLTLDDQTTLVVLATSRQGYANLCRVISRGRLRSPKGSCTVLLEELCQHASGLLALAHAGLVLSDEPNPALIDAFGDRLYALMPRHREMDEASVEARLRERVQRYGLPLVATTEVLYHQRGRRPVQDVLTCLRHHVTLSEAGRLIRANAEHELPTPTYFAQLFADLPDAVARTREVADRCTFSLDELHYRYPSEQLPDGRSSFEHLRQLTLEGAAQRYPEGVPQDVRAQLERELSLIHELDYCGYFLTMHEIVTYCRSNVILCQGRGSAANSAVCFALGITAVDPVRMGLLFERFLSRERHEPPDIDLDIAHEQREQVIQHVYEKYGRERAAMVANVIRYRARSAVRDVGKVLGLPEVTLDRLAKLLGHHGDAIAPATLANAGLDPGAPVCGHLLALTAELQDFPRHLSIHPGGFLLGHEPIDTLVPVENGAMEGRTVIQWDKDDVEAAGLFKVDLLGLGALTQLDLAFRLLREHRGVHLSMATIPADDAKTYDMICAGDTVGVFQIESRAQMAMLPRLRPRNYYDLVIEVSIVRPGPITGGMVHPYLRRRNGEEEPEYPHPCLQPVLEKTLGVPLFQEQVMRLAVVAADYTPGEADQLRRDMAAWRRTGRIEGHRERLITRMMRKGIAQEFAERVFEQIKGFGDYGFPESHAASFALISYATSYIRAHYPAEFACSLLNAQPMGFYAPATLIDDAKRHGVEMRPLDVAASHWHCTLEPSSEAWAVRMGLRYLEGLPEAQAQVLLQERARAPFASVDDLVRRTSLNERMLVRLAEAGALESLQGNRRQTVWDVRGAVARRHDALPLPLGYDKKAVRFEQLGLFETITWDYEATGHSTQAHPLGVLREKIQRMGLPDAASVRRMPNGRRVRYAGMVICRQRPGTAKGVVFLTLEDETGFVNLVVWNDVYRRFELILKTASFLGVTGRVQAHHDVVHIVVERLWEPEILAPKVGSRDFH